MWTVNTHQAKSQLSALLAAVEGRGDSIIICRNGKPVAELRPLPRAKATTRPHPKLSKVVFREDPAKPLAPSDWPGAKLA